MLFALTQFHLINCENLLIKSQLILGSERCIKLKKNYLTFFGLLRWHFIRLASKIEPDKMCVLLSLLLLSLKWLMTAGKWFQNVLSEELFVFFTVKATKTYLLHLISFSRLLFLKKQKTKNKNETKTKRNTFYICLVAAAENGQHSRHSRWKCWKLRCKNANEL